MAEPKETYEKIMSKLKTFFEGVVSKEEMDALKAYLNPAVIPAKLSEMKTKDGKTLSIEGELAEGSVIKEASAEGLKDLADGDYIIVAEGKEVTVSVAGGKIAKIVAPAAPAPADMAQLKEQFETKLSDQKKSYEVKLSEQNKELTELKKQVATLTAHVVKMLETPINLTETTPVKKYEDMTPYEKIVYERENRKK